MLLADALHYGFVSRYHNSSYSAQQQTEAQTDARHALGAVDRLEDLMTRHALVLKTFAPRSASRRVSSRNQISSR